MRRFITERNLVIVLFVAVIIIFSFAERDTKKIEHLYISTGEPAPFTLKALAELQVKTANHPSSLKLAEK